jgi:hypothetical protein
MSFEETNERQEQAGVPISFRAPRDLARAIEQAAGKELISTSAYCRRAVARSLERASQ